MRWFSVGAMRAIAIVSRATRHAMIQDIIVNLAVGRPHDPAVGCAVSVAKTLEADLVGIAFCYEPPIVTGPMDAIPADFIETQRAVNAKAAREAIARFKQATA